MPAQRSEHKPRNTERSAHSEASIDLTGGVVVQIATRSLETRFTARETFLPIYVHPTLRNNHSASQRRKRQPKPLPHGRRHVRLALIRPPRIVPDHHPQAQVDGEEGDELRVRARHAVTFAQHLRGSVLANPPLEHPVQRLTCHLPREHEQDFHLARGVDEGRIGDAEGLRDEGEEGAGVGDFGGWVVVDVGEGE